MARQAVADSGPLIALQRIGLLHLAPSIFSSIAIPAAVARELGPVLLRGNSWIEIHSTPAAPLGWTCPQALDAGECEAFLLARELNPDAVLVDDREARIWAQQRGFPVLGTLGLLLVAKRCDQAGDLQPLLDLLRLRGVRIDQSLYRMVLAEAGEA